MYYIWSIEHNAWWGKNNCGYQTSITEAGLYDEDTANGIIEEANMFGHFNECMIPEMSIKLSELSSL